MAAIDPTVELTLTTNAALLAKHAADLKAAGLHRITVSLDALDDAVFKQMNDADYPVSDVLAGIAAAQKAGFEQLKVNCVVQKSVNARFIKIHDILWIDALNLSQKRLPFFLVPLGVQCGFFYA